MIRFSLGAVALIVLVSSCGNVVKEKPVIEEEPVPDTDKPSLIYPQEKHFKSLTQLTFGGDNAEAYFSFDQTKLVFQANYSAWNTSCDQIFLWDLTAELDTNQPPKMLSNGLGRTTCSYFLPDDKHIVYASTYKGDSACPPAPERRDDGKYVWPIYQSFDIYVADLEGDIVDTLVSGPGYDAEATVSPKGDKIVFTSDRSGDLELYTCNIDGSDIKQITDELGYDGGAFFSPDGTELIFRASRPKTPEAQADYKALLKQGLVTPTEMELFICDINGDNLRQITDLGKANWAPFFHPSGKKVIFSSNHAGKRGYEFNLYMIDTDGNNLERISHDEVFDAFPMFSPDGKQLIFSSNRNNGGTRATNLFLAEWAE